MNPRTKLIKEYAEALIIALVLAFFIRTFVVQAFKIPSGSMLNTLLIGDHLLVNKFSYGIKLPFTHTILVPMGDPKFQDIIVFEYPKDPSKDFIKRVIGLPGDRIEVRDKELYRNGEKLVETYVQHVDPRLNASPRDNLPEFTVPQGKYFVLGDNRDESMDSRYWGLVDRGAIVGKAWRIYFSWDGPAHIRWDRFGRNVHALNRPCPLVAPGQPAQ